MLQSFVYAIILYSDCFVRYQKINFDNSKTKSAFDKLMREPFLYFKRSPLQIISNEKKTTVC